MMRVSARRSTGMGRVEMRSMTLPLISTWDGAERTGPLPSKMRTFSNNVTAPILGAEAEAWAQTLRCGSNAAAQTSADAPARRARRPLSKRCVLRTMMSSNGASKPVRFGDHPFRLIKENC